MPSVVEAGSGKQPEFPRSIKKNWPRTPSWSTLSTMRKIYDNVESNAVSGGPLCQVVNLGSIVVVEPPGKFHRIPGMCWSASPWFSTRWTTARWSPPCHVRGTAPAVMWPRGRGGGVRINIASGHGLGRHQRGAWQAFQPRPRLSRGLARGGRTCMDISLRGCRGSADRPRRASRLLLLSRWRMLHRDGAGSGPLSPIHHPLPPAAAAVMTPGAAHLGQPAGYQCLGTGFLMLIGISE